MPANEDLVDERTWVAQNPRVTNDEKVALVESAWRGFYLKMYAAKAKGCGGELMLASGKWVRASCGDVFETVIELLRKGAELGDGASIALLERSGLLEKREAMPASRALSLLKGIAKNG